MRIRISSCIRLVCISIVMIWGCCFSGLAVLIIFATFTHIGYRKQFRLWERTRSRKSHRVILHATPEHRSADQILNRLVSWSILRVICSLCLSLLLSAHPWDFQPRQHLRNGTFQLHRLRTYGEQRELPEVECFLRLALVYSIGGSTGKCKGNSHSNGSSQ